MYVNRWRHARFDVVYFCCVLILTFSGFWALTWFMLYAFGMDKYSKQMPPHFYLGRDHIARRLDAIINEDFPLLMHLCISTNWAVIIWEWMEDSGDRPDNRTSIAFQQSHYWIKFRRKVEDWAMKFYLLYLLARACSFFSAKYICSSKFKAFIRINWWA